MLTPLATLILLISVSLTQPAEFPPQISLMEVGIGQNASLQCQVSEKEGKFFHWYKQTHGYLIQTVATGTFSMQSLQGQFRNSRFAVTEGMSHYSLTIANVAKEDEATYFCQNGTAYSQTFVNGIFLAVNDQNQQKSVIVQQSPETASVRPGASVILQCSLLFKHKENLVQCPGEHSVHWFRAGSGRSRPDFIYTQCSRDEQEEKSCVYSLSKTIHNSSDAGTYYCAVVTCGEILFGGGTKVQTTQEQNLLVIALGVLLALCVIVIAVLVSLPRS